MKMLFGDLMQPRDSSSVERKKIDGGDKKTIIGKAPLVPKSSKYPSASIRSNEESSFRFPVQRNGTWTTHEESLSDNSIENKSILKSMEHDTKRINNIDQYHHNHHLQGIQTTTATKTRSLPFDVSINPNNNDEGSSTLRSDAWINKPKMEICTSDYRSSPIDDFITQSSDSWDDSVVDTQFFDTTRERSLIDLDGRDDAEDLGEDDDDDESYRDAPIDMMRSRSIDFHKSVSETFNEEDHSFTSMPKLATGPNSHLRGSSIGYEDTNNFTSTNKWMNMGLASSVESSVSSINNHKGSSLTEAQFLQCAEKREKQKKQRQAESPRHSKEENTLQSMLMSFLTPFQCGTYNQE
mmetsp:Transcript_24672/g.38011  ORF Transcript_24672/g.38011 Transcript_24672/m.38011 type:complete len:352 (+) Transcript_24672:207-1262(+)